MQVHIDRNGKRFGPYSIEDINAYLANGTLLPTDLAWQDGMTDWLPLPQVPGVQAGDLPPAPPAPPPSPDVPPIITPGGPPPTPSTEKKTEEVASQERKSHMEWEYQKTTIERDADENEHMNEHGADGWELVCVTFDNSHLMGVPQENYYWKRPLEDEDV